jgi:anti-sigma regulatory factor (Ser/Thr protein kinase)
MTVTIDEERTPRQEVVLAAAPLAPREARAWISGVLGDRLTPDRRSALDLILSEVVTNAVLHGAPEMNVVLAATPKPQFLCVQVTDEGPGLVPRPGAMASEANGGFGLFIVEQLSRRWGVTREARRTRVWFEFDYEQPAA